MTDLDTLFSIYIPKDLPNRAAFKRRLVEMLTAEYTRGHDDNQAIDQALANIPEDLMDRL